MTVNLPDPFGPRKPKIEPLATESEKASTADKWPKRLVTLSHSIIVSAGMAVKSAQRGLRKIVFAKQVTWEKF